LKTGYILRYGNDPELPRVVGRQLNRGEQRHDLAGSVFFGNKGEFRSGDYVELINKASCLSLLSNAIVAWNAVRIGQIVEQLRRQGDQVEDEDLAHISPLMYEHVITAGTYSFELPNP